VQRGHLSPQAPRKFTRPELVEQVKRWCAEGRQVFAVQESCGFGFVLHRQLVEAGAQSFLITPVVLNGKRKTDKFDARALCLRLSRWGAAISLRAIATGKIHIPAARTPVNANFFR